MPTNNKIYDFLNFHPQQSLRFEIIPQKFFFFFFLLQILNAILFITSKKFGYHEPLIFISLMHIQSYIIFSRRDCTRANSSYCNNPAVSSAFFKPSLLSVSNNGRMLARLRINRLMTSFFFFFFFLHTLVSSIEVR